MKKTTALFFFFFFSKSHVKLLSDIYSRHFSQHASYYRNKITKSYLHTNIHISINKHRTYSCWYKIPACLTIGKTYHSCGETLPSSPMPSSPCCFSGPFAALCPLARPRPLVQAGVPCWELGWSWATPGGYRSTRPKATSLSSFTACLHSSCMNYRQLKQNTLFVSLW